MSYKNILIRADSSSTFGTGHIMRDLVLAKNYSTSNITFATRSLKGNINNKITQNRYEIKILKSNDIKELSTLIKTLEINLLIIDHYDITYNQEKKLKVENPTITIMVLDGTYKQHYCDILLNHNIYAKKKQYKQLVPNWCKLKCGPKYTLLRDEFYEEKNKAYKLNKKFTFFIAMGGADTAHLNIKILKVLKKFKHIKINLFTTSANRNLEELQSYCQTQKWIKLYINSNKIAKLMSKSDFAITTPSVTANELYFMQLPFLAIKTADNQQKMYQFLKNNDTIVLNKFSKRTLFNKIKNILNKK